MLIGFPSRDSKKNASPHPVLFTWPNAGDSDYSSIVLFGGLAVKTNSPATSGNRKKLTNAGVVEPRKSLDRANGNGPKAEPMTARLSAAPLIAP